MGLMDPEYQLTRLPAVEQISTSSPAGVYLGMAVQWDSKWAETTVWSPLPFGSQGALTAPELGMLPVSPHHKTP